MDRKDIADISKLIKEFVRYFLMWSGSRSDAWQDHMWLGEDKPEKKFLEK